MSLRDDFQPKWKLLLKWGWLSFAVFILMAPTFYTVYISFNELGFGAAKGKNISLNILLLFTPKSAQTSKI